MVVPARGRGAADWLARRLVLHGLAGIVGHFAIGVAKDHATGISKVSRSSATTIASDFEVLPLMIGYFSLNVPAGLTLYWFFNNIVTTAQTVYLRKTTKPIVNVGGATAAGDGGGASSQPVSGLRSERERRSGATIPKVAAPKVDVSNAISAEFTDFDDGPAKVKSAVRERVRGF